MKISFIIPAYNASEYIARCLNSIYRLGMDTSDFEVIVVDDCSTDNTAEVVQQLQQDKVNYPNLILLKQPFNNRQGAARNKGVTMAKGRYVHFVDSDDIVGEGISKALDQAYRHDLEMMALNYSGKGYKTLPYTEDEVFTGVRFQEEHPYWCPAPCEYLFLLSFLKRVNYPFVEGVLYEDSDFVMTHLSQAQRFGFCREICYRYLYNGNSVTKTHTFKHFADYFLLGTRMLKIHETLQDKNTKFASSILEGAGHNVHYPFTRMYRLSSPKEISLMYDRIDKRVRRTDYLKYREPKMYWDCWTKFCLKHRVMVQLISIIAIPSVKMWIRMKHK